MSECRHTRVKKEKLTKKTILYTSDLFVASIKLISNFLCLKKDRKTFYAQLEPTETSEFEP